MEAFISTITDNILTPALMLIAGAVILLAKSYVKKITDSLVVKNELESLEKTQTVKTKVLEEIYSAVQSAVACNMQLANDMKETGNKLSDEQIKSLNEKAKTIALNSLPNSITSEDGALLKIIGGKEVLNVLIDSYMERAVYEYQILEGKKKKQS